MQPPITFDEITDQTRAEAAELGTRHADVLLAHGTAEAEAVREGAQAALQHVEDRIHRLRARRRHARTLAVDAYHGQPDQLFADLAADLGVSLAIVDQATVSSYLGSPVDDNTWSAVRPLLAPLAFDDYLAADPLTRNSWIALILRAAGITSTNPTDTSWRPA